jgi:hypothetical protein
MALSTFSIIMVVVSEPTPPGTGVMALATSSTSGVTSPQMLLPSGSGVDARVDDHGAGGDHVLGHQAGETGRGHHDLATLALAGQVHGLGVAYGDGGVALNKQAGQGRPTVSPRPTRVTFLPLSSMPARSIKAMQASGVAGTRARCSWPPKR